MNSGLRDSLAQVQELFRETSGNRWAAEGARVVSDPEYKVYKGHIADCVEDDDAAFIAACHQLFRDHIPALLAMMDDHSPDAGKMGWEWRTIESAPRDGERIILGRPDLDGDGGGISVAGYWLEELEDGVDYMGNDGGFTDVDFQVFQPGRSFGAESYRYAGSQPTHWRPLPAPPTEDAARAGERG